LNEYFFVTDKLLVHCVRKKVPPYNFYQ